MSCLGLLGPNTVPRILANAHRDLHEEKGHFRTMAIKPGSSSWLDEGDGDGLENSPLGVESCGKDSCSMGSRGKGRRKKMKKIRGRLSPKIM